MLKIMLAVQEISNKHVMEEISLNVHIEKWS